MSTSNREFQIFAKPVGAECNLRCSYCYYLGKKELYKGKNSPLMDEAVLEKYVIQHIQATTDNIINFSWHGGEPLLAGIEFYKKAVAFQKKFKPEGKVIMNGIQTNGTLLNSAWCSFLSKEKFNVGISIDGPGDLHNVNRKTPEKESTLQDVLKGFELLKKYGIIPEILCVVNSGNVKFPLAVYGFIRALGAKYISFLPLVEPRKSSPTGVSKNTVGAIEFGSFLSIIFDEWVEKDIGEIKIQIFEEAARIAFKQQHTLCIFKVNCGGVPVVEYTGDFYSCDHYVDNEHFLGNIKEHSLAYFLDSEKQIDFGESKSLTLLEYCRKCEVLSMCNGECPKNRFTNSPEGEYGLNYLCSGYKYFFNHCRPFVEAIAEAWRNQNK
jgi:uncharacterized protein